MKSGTAGLVLPRAFLRRCRSALFRQKIADSTGASLTGGSLLMRTLILRRLLRRHVLCAEERFVGLLLPPTVPGVVANAAVVLAGKVPVNLNYTVSSDTLNYCLAKCSIRHVLTSRKFMERFDYKLNAELVFLEDFREKVTLADKIVTAACAYGLPAAFLERRLGLHTLKPDDLFTVIFTSGSTGKPKGVMLSFANVGANVDSVSEVLHLVSSDVVCGILPLFHSMGFTITLWAVLSLDVGGAYHFSPLDAKVIGKLCHDHRATILLATPTFLRGYLRRCTKEEFSTINLVVAGAEKLPNDLLAAFEEKFGVRPMEGYGTTECAPVVAVNIPPSRALGATGLTAREGTVGRPIPRVKVKVVDHERGNTLPVGEAGLLCVQGPNVMQGYYEEAARTAEVMRDGWYVTGDMAQIDSDGFIHITGRLSRFSKIGGEMVPHVHLEELLQRMLSTDEEKLSVAVTAVHDDRKGERLIVFHLPTGKTPQEMAQQLSAQGVPNLWIPGTDSFFTVDAIPALGTGKLDLQAVRELARQRVAEATQRAGASREKT